VPPAYDRASPARSNHGRAASVRLPREESSGPEPGILGEIGLVLDLAADTPHGVEARQLVGSPKNSVPTSRFINGAVAGRTRRYNRRILRNLNTHQ